jgi:lysophospholipid acyltransferase (LPLAT)-like uncharacterized protein
MEWHLCGFTPETYRAFAESGCSTMGFVAEERPKAQQVRVGDRLVCFMTRLWRWVGVLEVTGESFEGQGPLFYPRGDPFVVRMRVKPVVWLEAGRSVPFQEMPAWDRLAFVKGHSQGSMTWKHVFLKGLVRLDDADGRALQEVLRSQSEQPRDYAFNEKRYTKFLTNRTRRQTLLYRVRRKVSYSPRVVGLLAAILVAVFRAYFKTLKVKVEYHPEFLKLDRRRAIYAFWHGRQFLLVPSFGSWGSAVMTDWSWLGELQTHILKRFGYLPVRGSSERRGARALLTMKKTMEAGAVAALAVDGPTGPIYTSKPGILFLAAKLGYPIVPAATSAERAWIVKRTWCRYLLPKPFSRCLVALGQPIAEAAEGKLTSAELDRTLMAWTAELDRRCGREPDTERPAAGAPSSPGGADEGAREPQ